MIYFLLWLGLMVALVACIYFYKLAKSQSEIKIRLTKIENTLLQINENLRQLKRREKQMNIPSVTEVDVLRAELKNRSKDLDKRTNERNCLLMLLNEMCSNHLEGLGVPSKALANTSIALYAVLEFGDEIEGLYKTHDALEARVLFEARKNLAKAEQRRVLLELLGLDTNLYKSDPAFINKRLHELRKVAQ